MAEAKLPDREGVLKTLPRYKSHKVIWALEIARTETRIDGVLLHFVEEFAPLLADAKMTHRYTPVAGDRLVIYADGYRSLSPRAAFEDGYGPA